MFEGPSVDVAGQVGRHQKGDDHSHQGEGQGGQGTAEGRGNAVVGLQREEVSPDIV